MNVPFSSSTAQVTAVSCRVMPLLMLTATVTHQRLFMKVNNVLKRLYVYQRLMCFYNYKTRLNKYDLNTSVGALSKCLQY